MTEKAIPKTRLRIFYEAPLQAHAIRNWIAGHPRIVLPIGMWRGVVAWATATEQCILVQPLFYSVVCHTP
jgi:hypothetical protein